MPIVKADLNKCQGYANCVVAADDTFDIGDDGVVVLLRAGFPEADRARVETAARACPVSALTVAEE
jgi:ferredoxin